MRIDYSLIRIIPASDSHKEFSYQVKKAAEGEYIRRIWGWDENFQRNYHERDWQEFKPGIITYNEIPVGTIAVIESEDEDNIEIRRFFILPEYQNKGIGTYILKQVISRANLSNKLLTLKYLKNNPVVTLYERTGFLTVNIDKTYIFMERKPGSVPSPGQEQ